MSRARSFKTIAFILLFVLYSIPSLSYALQNSSSLLWIKSTLEVRTAGQLAQESLVVKSKTSKTDENSITEDDDDNISLSVPTCFELKFKNKFVRLNEIQAKTFTLLTKYKKNIIFIQTVK